MIPKPDDNLIIVIATGAALITTIR